MKKLLIFLTTMMFGCATEDYTIHPSYVMADTVYILNTTGHNPLFGAYERDMAAVTFCAEKNAKAHFISKNLYGGANHYFTAKFICVK